MIERDRGTCVNAAGSMFVKDGIGIAFWNPPSVAMNSEIGQALGTRVEPRNRGWRKGIGGIEGEQIWLDFD
jgi:hypothetical protein